MHTARFLPARALGPPQREERDGGGDADVGARWARCGRRARWGRCARNFPMATTWTTILDLLDGDIEGRGQPGAARRRWRRRAGARAVGRIRGRGARGIVGLVGRAAARGRDGGAAWRAPWERAAAQGRGSVGAGRGPDGAGERASVDARLGWRGAGDGVGGSYSLKLASIAATRSFSASMSCWFTSSIFCKSAGEAFST